MTRRSIHEYAAAIRERCVCARKRAKSAISNQLVRVTGYHRKAAVRLLRQDSKGARGRGPGHPRQYGQEVAAALKALWEASDRFCSRRLQPFLPELLAALERHGESRLAPPVTAQVRTASRATVEPYRAGLGRRGRSTTTKSCLLKSQAPIRTFAQWEDAQPGFVEVDLVAHCGESSRGFYLHTLSAVDVATGWVEFVPVWGKSQTRVGGAVHQACLCRHGRQVRRRLPVSLRGLDADNSSEFLNQHLYGYCRRERITFTRCRAYHKNDQAHGEQKNGAIVRRLIGYDRYSSRAAYAQLGMVYQLVRRYANFFQPVVKLVGKERVGSRVRKRH